MEKESKALEQKECPMGKYFFLIQNVKVALLNNFLLTFVVPWVPFEASPLIDYSVDPTIVN